MATTPQFDDNYQSVADRIRIFRDKYPEGSLTALDPGKPFEIVTVEKQAFVVVAATAMRHPEDKAPGVGLAWCPIPGRDEYTRDSEIQNCFHPDTDLLTPAGWVSVEKIVLDVEQDGDLTIAQVDPNGHVSWVRPTNPVRRANVTEWVEIEDNLTYQRVTTDHRVLWGGWIVPAWQCADTHGFPHHTANHTGGDGFADGSEDAARLLAWIQGDGSITKTGTVQFGFKKARKIERLAALFNRMDLDHSCTPLKNGVTNFYLRNAAMRAIGCVTHDDAMAWKNPSIEALLAMTRAQFDAFVEEILYVDASLQRDGIYLRTTDMGFIEALATVAPLHGWNALSLAYDERSGGYTHHKTQQDGKPLHRVRLKRHARPMKARVETVRTTPTDALCVSVPSGVVVTRMKGKTTITGQCQTSAWGRAIIAVLAADSTKIASVEEVRSAQSHRGAPVKKAAPAPAPEPAPEPAPQSATANGTSVKPEAAPTDTDPAQEEYNTSVITEVMRLLNDPTTTYDALKDVWQVLTQARLAARRITPPAGMEPDGDGLVPIGSAVAFVGKERKIAADAAPAAQPELTLVPDAPAAKRTRKAATPSV